MPRIYSILPAILFYFAAATANAQTIPPGDAEPVIRLEAGGPTSFVTTMQFSLDGKRLYAAGFDKVVRVWTLNADTGRFQLDRMSYRIPIGPGLDGAINAMALSSDEKWLAVAGQAVIRGGAGFRIPGLILPKIGTFTDAMWADMGMIYVFNTRNQEVRVLRGHRGPVLALTFAPAHAQKPPLLVSAARSWDKDKNEYIGEAKLWNLDAQSPDLGGPADLPSKELRPGLAVWHTGERVDQLRVALACEDGYLRVWNAEKKTDSIVKVEEPGWVMADGVAKYPVRYNNSVVAIGGDLLATASERSLIRDRQTMGTQIRKWRLTAEGTPVADDLPLTLFASDQDKGVFYFPRVLAATGIAADKSAEMLAIVLRVAQYEDRDGKRVLKQSDRLALIDAKNGDVKAQHELWPASGKMPVLSTASTGKHIAIAGNRDHAISVFAIADLIKGGATAQRLQSAGQAWGFAAFVRKGEERGVLVGESVAPLRAGTPRAPRDKDAILDLARRQVTRMIDGWNIDAPDLGQWKVEQEKDAQGRFVQPFVFNVNDGTNVRQVKKPFDLKEAEVVTDYALLPPRAPWNVPLLAVAYFDIATGQPWLILFNAATGEQVRQYTGHTERIHSLAFSSDGQLLASTSEDQTICIWTTAKLDRYLGKLGMLPGVAVRNAFVVRTVNRNDPALKSVEALDIIEGISERGIRRTFSSLRGFFAALARYPAGEKVTLAVRGPEGQSRERITVTIGSGLDERAQSWLLGLSAPNAIDLVILGNAAELFSPLPGLSLKHAPVVAQVRSDSSSKDLLREGDLIEGVMAGEAGLRSFNSARDFYEAMAQRKPREKVILQVRGKGRVELVVGQGSDERKPLFSLFVTRARADAPDEWVGWSPIGPYEASERKAERHIGWHFNTGDPLHPASFALADQYRKEHYREGILELLVRHADLSPAVKEWNRRDMRKPLPQPRLTLGIDEPNRDPAELVGRDRIVARRTPVSMQLAVDDFPADRIAAIRYQVDGGEFRSLPVGSDRDRQVLIDIGRGSHRVRFAVMTLEDQQQTFVKDVTIHVLPPSPVVVLKSPRQQVVAAAAYRFQAEVASGQIGQEVKITLTQRHGDKVLAIRSWSIAKSSNPAKPTSIDAEFALQAGENRFELVAVNADAGADPEGQESTRAAAVVVFQPPAEKAPPPVITLDNVVVPSDNGGADKRTAVDPARAIVVNSARVRVQGQVASAANLADVRWQRADQQPQALDGFKDSTKQMPIDQTVELSPGSQTLVFSAKSASSETATAKLTLDYRPALPEFFITAPADGATFYDEGKGEYALTVNGVLLPANTHPFQAELLLNNQPVGAIATDKAEWDVPITLKQPGTNRLQVRLKNEWNVQALSEPVAVRLVRPPYGIEFEAADTKAPMLKTDKPLIDLVARVRSPLPLVAESIEAEVNDSEFSNFELLAPNAQRDSTKRTGIRLKNVPLIPGENKVSLWVGNTESRCRKPGEIVVIYTPPAQPPALPEVEIIEPAKDANVTEPDITIRYRVKTASPLKRLEVVRESATPLREIVDISVVKPVAPGVYEFRQAITLRPRANPIRVTAVNEGGEHQAAVVLNYVHMPVRLTIESVAPWRTGGPKITPRVLADGQFVFPTLPQGRMTLSGSVQWSKEDDEQLQKTSIVRVFVNGFQQVPAELKPAESGRRERRFRAELLLNRATENRVEIELPNQKQDVSNRREFSLACAKPEQGQRLHLLIVGVGPQDEKSIASQALLALRANRDRDQIRTPAFSQVRIYGPLTGFVTPEQVFTQLCLIKKTIDLLASDGSSSDVVMLYYQGAEAVRSDGNFFETSVSKYDRELRRSAITFQGFRGFFDDTLGAKLLMLDVKRLAMDKQARNELAALTDDTYFGVFHNRPAQANERNLTDLLGVMKQAIDRNLGVVGAVGMETASLFKNYPLSAYDWYVRPSLAETLIGPKK